MSELTGLPPLPDMPISMEETLKKQILTEVQHKLQQISTLLRQAQTRAEVENIISALRPWLAAQEQLVMDLGQHIADDEMTHAHPRFGNGQADMITAFREIGEGYVLSMQVQTLSTTLRQTNSMSVRKWAQTQLEALGVDFEEENYDAPQPPRKPRK